MLYPAAVSRSTADGRRQRATRRHRAEPAFDSVRPPSTSDLQSCGQSGDDRLTPNFVDGVVNGKNMTDDNDEGVLLSRVEFGELETVRHRQGRPTRIRSRRQANDDAADSKSGGESHRETAKSVPGSGTHTSVSVSNSNCTSESVVVLQGQASTSPNQLGREMSSSTSNNSCSTDNHPLSVCGETSLQSSRKEPPPHPNPHTLSLISCGSGDQSGIEKDEQRLKTTSGNAQTACSGTLDGILADTSSEDVLVNFRATKEDDQTNTEMVAEITTCSIPPGMSAEASELSTSSPDDQQSFVFLIETQRSSATLNENRHRTNSVSAVKRRRRPGKHPASRPTAKSPASVVPTVLHNGVKQSSNQDIQTSESTRPA